MAEIYGLEPRISAGSWRQVRFLPVVAFYYIPARISFVAGLFRFEIFYLLSARAGCGYSHFVFKILVLLEVERRVGRLLISLNATVAPNIEQMNMFFEKFIVKTLEFLILSFG